MGKTKTGDVWNVEELLNGKTFEEIISGIKSSVEKFKEYRSILNNKLSASKLLEIIKDDEYIERSICQIDTYYFLKFIENNKDSETLTKKSQLEQITADLSNDMEFFELWFKKLDDEIADKFIQSEELKNYKYHLTQIKKESKYSKSEEIEKILTLKNTTGSSSFAQIYQMITDNYSFEFNGKKASANDLISKYSHKSPEIREKAINTLLSRYRKDSELLTEIYKKIVLSEGNDSIKIRGYPTHLNRVNQGEGVSDKSVDTLLNVIRKNSGYFKEYFEIKHAFNKKQGEKYPFSRYHLLAPIASSSEKKYTYQQGKEIS
ncbi:MAG TPA: hypothetical protein VEC16_01685, partial [Alphaproteobacteria bacterium]|nr:hypothetical protein [Alphaproteobacteria bacterium]